MEQNRLADFAKTARDAVADLEEPFKTEAFKIILQRLVAGGPPVSAAGTGIASPLATNVKAVELRRKKAAGGKKEKQAPGPSTLNLGVEDIKSLIAYVDGFDLGATELVAFILANFVREHIGLDVISDSDIVYLYRLLIGQKVKVVARNDASDWTRALGWLAAPSRRKEWLVKRGDGYLVSNSGLLQWNDMQAKREQARKAK